MVAGFTSIQEEAYLNLVPSDECTGCSACMNSCPIPCITMRQNRSGFRYPYADLSACIRCGKCYSACPVLNVAKKSRSKHLFYGCKHKDDEIRNNSSSGGFFYELARYVLSKGGVVFGAAFTEDYHRVIHIHAQTLKELGPIRVSKYLQSEVDLSFPAVKEFLTNNKFVLFSGTPCQIAGLKSFLGDSPDNLILTEVVCHGVPSPKVWDLYISSLENNSDSKVRFVTFRDKVKSWLNSDFVVCFDDGTEFRQANSDNLYMKAFLTSLSIRPSCTDCRFKRFQSGADITMGDFWGSSELGASYKDDIGISVISLNSDKGRRFFEQIVGSFKGVVKLSEKEAFVFNESYAKSAMKNRYSSVFLDSCNIDNIEELIQRYAISLSNKQTFPSSVLDKINNQIKRLLKCFLGQFRNCKIC